MYTTVMGTKTLCEEEQAERENVAFGLDFCDWIKTLPYSERITGDTQSKKENVDKN